MADDNIEGLASRVVASVRSFVARATAPLKQTVRGPVTQADDHGQKLDSLERRANRHADHLAALESRLKRLEHGGDQ